MLLSIQPGIIIMIAVTVVLIGVIIALYFFGKKQQKKQEEQKAQLASIAQSQTMLIIDKKKVRIKESGLPQQVIDQTPWYAKRAKLPIVKAKVGPKVMSLIADDEIFDLIPVKKEVKATVSGLYITGVKGVHGAIEAPARKLTFREKVRAKYDRLTSGEQEKKESKQAKQPEKSGKKKK